MAVAVGTVSITLTNLGAGSHPITASFSGVANYAASATTNASTQTVNPLPAVLTGTRPYDGTATVSNSVLTVSNPIGADGVTVASGSGTLAGANVGAEAIASFGTLALGGSSSANYTLTGAGGSVIITVPPFSITSGYVDSSRSNLIINWQSAPGGIYEVLGRSDASAPLTNVGSPITATGTNTSATNPMNQSIGIFQVKSQ